MKSSTAEKKDRRLHQKRKLQDEGTALANDDLQPAVAAVTRVEYLYDVSTAFMWTPDNHFPIYSTDSNVNVNKKRLVAPNHTDHQYNNNDRSNEDNNKLSVFTFHRMLGSGSYGKVLLASYKPNKKLVAVKIANKHQITEEDPECATLERDVLEKVQENTLFTHLHQSFQTKNHLFYVMEYIEGGTLKSFRDSQTSLDLESIKLYAAELTSGLSFLHSKYIIHRDLKPENVLVTRTGHLKIADFGLSIILDDQYATTIGFAGTLVYAAPEMITNKYYSYGVDWWSLGVTLFYLQTKRLPFVGQNRIKIMQKILKTEPSYPENIHSEVKDLIMQLLYKKPSTRLGVNGDICSHGLFKNIHWTDVENGLTVPPIHPDSIPFDTKNIITRIIPSHERNQPMCSTDQRLFEGFSYRSPDWS